MKPSDSQFSALESELVPLFRRLIPTIGNDYRATDDPEDDQPGMSVTIGATPADDGTLSWSYQTGDNSYSGGAYGHPFWGVVSLFRDSDPAEIASDCVNQIADLIHS